jgi:hypothetical protein
MKSLFPDSMMKAANVSSIEDAAARLSYFFEQLHLYHFQTNSYAEHTALGGFYDYVGDFKDGVIEKMMGYEGRRIKAYSIAPLKDYTPGSSSALVRDIKSFSDELCSCAQACGMPDIENMSQELSGQAAKTLYLLTLS